MSLNRTKFLEPHEETALVNSLDLTKRDDVIILLALESGARASEILNLRPIDLFDDSSSVFIRTLKQGNDRELPLKGSLYQAVKNFVPFNIKYRRLEQIWDYYRPVKKKFHALRHTFAVNLYKRTKDIKLVQLALGHASPTTTSIYTDFIYSREEMQKILK